jgi:pimeloyl-ACP methyl ester carboxylesterase
MTTGNYSHVDMVWEDPGIALFLRTLASFSRLIVFDRRGTGASDPQPPGSLPPWESYAQDLTAVLDEVGSQQAALLAQLDASPMALFFAGTRPERTRALILANAAAMFAPSRAGDRRFCRWFARFQRAVASPGARLVELDGTEQALFWETPEAVLDHIERFLTGMRRGVQPTRTLATVPFTDIVSSTERAGELGDRRWRKPLNVHDELTGRAIHAAVALREELAGIGFQLRAGLHTGEVGLRGDDVGGLAVHIAARVMAAAGLLKGIDGDWQLLPVARP